MKVILAMVQTVNGMIAKENYSEDFLSDASWKIWKSLAEEIGCFIVGRKTYELVMKWDGENFDDVKSRKIILSKNKSLRLSKDYFLANSPEGALEVASKFGFEKVLVSGGGKINSSFLKKHLIDEIILIIEPYVLGTGIKIFSDEDFENKLKLMDIKKFKSGIMQLRYKIIK